MAGPEPTHVRITQSYLVNKQGLAATLAQLDVSAFSEDQRHHVEVFKAGVLKELLNVKGMLEREASQVVDKIHFQKLEQERDAQKEKISKLEYRIVHLLRTIERAEADKKCCKCCTCGSTCAC